jgi:hypothetical protein
MTRHRPHQQLTPKVKPPTTAEGHVFAGSCFTLSPVLCHGVLEHADGGAEEQPHVRWSMVQRLGWSEVAYTLPAS